MKIFRENFNFQKNWLTFSYPFSLISLHAYMILPLKADGYRISFCFEPT